MAFGSQTTDHHTELDRVVVENVEEFEYLGSIVTWANDCSMERQSQIQIAPGAMAGFYTIWKSKGLSTGTKLRVLNV